jgi:MFS family permease
MLMAALTFFTVGSVMAATATGMTGLLVARCIQGIGGGGIVALTYVITTDLVSLQERGKWCGLISLQWAIGSVTGPILGGAIVQETTWRWIFWLNLPFCGLALVAIPICLRLDHKVGLILENLKTFDWIGSLVFVVSMTSFLVPLTWGESCPIQSLKTSSNKKL